MASREYWRRVRQHDPDGAIEPTGCRMKWCRCGLCDRCGWPKHAAVHEPFYGAPVGSAPYGHTYVESRDADRAS